MVGMIRLPDCDNVATLFTPHAHHKLVVHHVVHAVHTVVDCLGGGGLGWNRAWFQPWPPYTEASLGMVAAPELSTWAMLVLGFLMVGVLNRYRRV